MNTRMMKFVGLLSLLLQFTGAKALWAEPVLSVTGNAFEGSALFVRVSGVDDDLTVKAKIEKKVYRLTRADNGTWEAVLPLSLDSRGSQKLVVKVGETKLRRTLDVKARSYGHQSISLSPATLAGYDNPQNKADDKAILDALEADETSKMFVKNFRLPVQAPQTTGFGLRRTYNGWKKGWHKGLDLAGWTGQAVAAPANGVVLHTARGIVNGNTIVLSHGAGLGSSYFHLNSIRVKVGQKIKRGQTIGTVGGTGGFSPHLHWEVRAQGVPVHPKVFFKLPASWRD